MKTNEIPIDLSYFYMITDGNKDFGNTLLSSALDDIEVHVAKLESCWLCQDVTGVKQSAHSLISLAAIAGMPAVEQWCRSIETALADGAMPLEIAPLIQNIITGWPEASVKLRRVLSEETSAVI